MDLKRNDIKVDFRRRIRERESLASKRAFRALCDLEATGLHAWVIGSLARDRFSLASDVDFLVSCPREREYEAFRIIESAMGTLPFDMIPSRRVRDEVLPEMMEGAVDASGLSSRQA